MDCSRSAGQSSDRTAKVFHSGGDLEGRPVDREATRHTIPQPPSGPLDPVRTPKSQGKTMHSRTIFSWALLCVAGTACGCGSAGMITRGQDAHAPAPGQFQSSRHPVAALQDHVSGQHTTFHSYDNSGMAGQYQQASCPPGGGAGSCPPQSYGGTCPHGVHGGGCQSCGNGPDWYPKHHRTYSYSVPNDLSYPAQSGAGAVGGAVVYPYYTHKGPSDFFRQK